MQSRYLRSTLASTLVPAQMPIVYHPSLQAAARGHGRYCKCQQPPGTTRKQCVPIPLAYWAPSSFYPGRNRVLSSHSCSLLTKILLPSTFWKHMSFMSVGFSKAQDRLGSYRFYDLPVPLQTTRLEAGQNNLP